MYRLYSLPVLLMAGVSIAAACDPPGEQKKIDVTVLAIMVSSQYKGIPPKLAEFAKHVRKKDATLTGFRLERTSSKKLELGQTKSFLLVDQQVVEVTVNRERNEQGRITLTIKPPKQNQITYACVCNKYFSMATSYYVGKGKSREQLFLAVMASPCGARNSRDQGFGETAPLIGQ